MTSKALIFSTAVVLAACSRNPEPGIDDTGRADTTMAADTAISARVDTNVVDTAAVLPTPAPTPDVQPSPTPSPEVQPAPIPGTDSTKVTDTSSVRRDSSNVSPAPVPSPSPSSDTSGNKADSAHVSHGADKFEGDSALIERTVPDSTADSTGSR